MISEKMGFTYANYQKLLELLSTDGYSFSSFCPNTESGKKVILRHDVDNSPVKAWEFAQFEHKLGVHSTYFVLLSSNFYNVFQRKTRQMLQNISSLGHDIGLHFDETAYFLPDKVAFVDKVQEEMAILGRVLGISIKSVSMHRPSPQTLEANYDFGALINSYSQRFFREYKYLSDSRMHWREDVFAVIESGEYDKLHILTHPFWYADQQESTRDKLLGFINEGNRWRYDLMDDNFRDLSEFVLRGEI